MHESWRDASGENSNSEEAKFELTTIQAPWLAVPEDGPMVTTELGTEEALEGIDTDTIYS